MYLLITLVKTQINANSKDIASRAVTRHAPMRREESY